MRSILLLFIAMVSTMASNVRAQKDDTFETAYAKTKTQTGHSFLGNKDLNTHKTMEKKQAHMSALEVASDAPTCHKAWSKFIFPSIHSEETTPITFQFKVEQAIEARMITSKSDFLFMVDQDPERAYANVEGTLILTPECEADNDGTTIFRADLDAVRVSCTSSKQKEREQCLLQWGELEMIRNSPFWFSWNANNGIISDVRLSYQSMTLETKQIGNFHKALIDVLSTKHIEGKCTVTNDKSNVDTTVKQFVVQDQGMHGQDATKQYPFQSITVHRLYGPSSTTMTTTLNKDDPSNVIKKAVSRTAYMLDVHGKTRSGRIRPHHFVHTSSVLVASPQEKVRIIIFFFFFFDKIKATLTDFFSLSSTQVSSLSTLPSNFICTSSNLRDLHAPTLRSEETQPVATSSLVEVQDKEMVKISPKDILKYVTDFLVLITEGKEFLTNGFHYVKTALEGIELRRVELFGGYTKYCVEAKSPDDGTQSAATILRLAAIAKGDASASTETGADGRVRYTTTTRLACEANAECHQDKRYGVGSTCEAKDRGQIGYGIEFLQTLKNTVTSAKNELISLKDGGLKIEDNEKIQRLIEDFKKLITEKFNTCIDFFVKNVVLVLNKLKDLIPVIVKNLVSKVSAKGVLTYVYCYTYILLFVFFFFFLSFFLELDFFLSILHSKKTPITDFLAKIMHVIGPALSSANDKMKTATAAGGENMMLLSAIPKSFTAQWTDSKVYKDVFSEKTGALPKILAWIDDNSGDSDGRGLQKSLQTLIEGVMNQVSVIIKEKIRDKLGEIKDEFVLAGMEAIKTLVSSKDTTESANKVVDGLVELLTDVESKVNTTKDFVEKLYETDDKLLKDVKTDVITKKDFVKQMYEKDNINELMKWTIRKSSSGLNKIEETVIKTKRNFDKLIETIGAGKSFSKRKEWNMGLMKGWSTQGYAQGTVSFSLLPKPTATAETLIGINYMALNPNRGGNLVELSIGE